jgi:hypothetical protein
MKTQPSTSKSSAHGPSTSPSLITYGTTSPVCAGTRSPSTHYSCTRRFYTFVKGLPDRGAEDAALKAISGAAEKKVREKERERERERVYCSKRGHLVPIKE